MRISTLLSTTLLLATTLAPISAYADDQNLLCRRLGCDSHGGGNGNLSISGLDINVKSSDRGNDKRNTVDKNETNDNFGKGNDDTVSADHPDTDDTDTDDTDNADAGNNDNNDNTTDNTNDGAGGNDTNNNNNSPPQLNSNDIDGFDPFGGLYGPGT